MSERSQAPFETREIRNGGNRISDFCSEHMINWIVFVTLLKLGKAMNQVYCSKKIYLFRMVDFLTRSMTNWQFPAAGFIRLSSKFISISKFQ